MRAYTDLFQINGKPMLVPDADIQMSYEDVDTEASGRDESGVMHRIVARFKIPTWAFTYSNLTEEEKTYMEGLFPESAEFTFTHPDPLDAAKTLQTVCYRSKYSIIWKNARTGLWSNYNFRIIAC